MSKNKLYLIISLITLICFFGIAALCNQTGEEEGETPTLNLEITQGPIYNQEDSTCYYIISALATGTPEPDIEFTLDDNVSLMSAEKAKVVLKDSADTYTLNVTATNSVGSTASSINLFWGCEEEEATGEEEAPESRRQKDEEREDGEIVQVETASPGISLFVYEGPSYSAADDVCFYRIRAIVTGHPSPAVEFSRDDSLGAFGPNKCQINLNRDQSYTLTATATNSVGSDSTSINLSWGCDGEEQSMPSPEAVDKIEVELHPITIGYAIDRGSVDYSTCFFGDSIHNTSVKGFFEFDLNSLVDKEIIKATLTLEDPTVHGNPSFESVCVILQNLFASTQLDTYEHGAGFILKTDCSGNSDFTESGDFLEGIIRDTIDPRSPNNMLKFKIYIEDNINDGNYAVDGREYTRQNISLVVEYWEQ